jgi:hypothetical protein
LIVTGLVGITIAAGVARAAEALGPGVAPVSTGAGVAAGVAGAGVAGAAGLGVAAPEPHAETTNPRASASPSLLFHELLFI